MFIVQQSTLVSLSVPLGRGGNAPSLVLGQVGHEIPGPAQHYRYY